MMIPQVHAPRASPPVPVFLETPHDRPAGTLQACSSKQHLPPSICLCGNASLFGSERAGPLSLACGATECFECFLAEGILILNGGRSNFILSLGKIPFSLCNASYV